jgi:membrane protein DedA with SNARE-associated domain
LIYLRLTIYDFHTPEVRVPDWLLNIFAQYGYGAVFVGVMLEGAGIPFPGETMLLAGAVLAHMGRLSLPWVIVAAAGGGLVGDNLGFRIGRLGGRALVVRYGSKVGLTASRLAQFDRFFTRHGPRTIFFARFVTGVRVFCAVLAGGSTLPWRVFALYNAAGVIVWSITIGLAGNLLGASWDTLERGIGAAGALALGAIVFVAAIAFIRSRRRETKTS